MVQCINDCIIGVCIIDLVSTHMVMVSGCEYFLLDRKQPNIIIINHYAEFSCMYMTYDCNS